MFLRARQRTIAFPRRPLLMGIVNINDDSFCADGTLDTAAALDHAARLAAEGADIIDAGAESARTNREPISEEAEIRRLTPFLEALGPMLERCGPRDDDQVWPPLISVNTWRPGVVEHVLPLGVDVLNDMGGLQEGLAANATLCARHGAALVLMHTVGLPKVPHLEEHYPDVWTALLDFFESGIARAREAGLSSESLILDPGIDFAKQRDDNLRILGCLDRLTRRHDLPVLLPVSRKTVIGEVLDLPDPNERDAGSVACLTSGVLRGAAIFRVHDVKGMFEALKILWAVEQAR